jgi:hypothetical protein
MAALCEAVTGLEYDRPVVVLRRAAASHRSVQPIVTAIGPWWSRPELTLSVNLDGSASDRARILSFLEDIDAELPAAYRWRNSISSR